MIYVAYFFIALLYVIFMPIPYNFDDIKGDEDGKVAIFCFFVSSTVLGAPFYWILEKIRCWGTASPIGDDVLDNLCSESKEELQILGFKENVIEFVSAILGLILITGLTFWFFVFLFFALKVFLNPIKYFTLVFVKESVLTLVILSFAPCLLLLSDLFLSVVLQLFLVRRSRKSGYSIDKIQYLPEKGRFFFFFL